MIARFSRLVEVGYEFIRFNLAFSRGCLNCLDCNFRAGAPMALLCFLCPLAPLGLLVLPECPLVPLDLHPAVLTGR